MAKVLVKGNEAIAQAAINAGCQCYFGYPITPQSEIGEYMGAHLPKMGRVFVTAESELASINMVIGAGTTGAKAITIFIDANSLSAVTKTLPILGK